MSEFKHPYYIFSPDYRESSGGIQALHKLCHQINLHGGQAWMVDCNIVNPGWNTPRLDDKTYNQHKKSEVIPIAVYPEIYSGNPLNTEVCVRYMLNHEALLNGNRLNESEEDLFFWYSSQLIVKEPDVDFLTMVGPDLDIFFDDGRVKTTKLLYLNRVPEDRVDFTTLPKDIIIISVKNPRPLVELAEILKSALVMYTFEWSGTCNLAALCGAPVVSMVAEGYEKLAISDASIRDMGGAGVCFSDDAAELQRTRAGLSKVRAHMRKFETDFLQQLTHFFNKTQQAAQTKSEEKFVSVENWLASYPANEHAQDAMRADFSVRVVVLDEGKSQALDSTLSSLNMPGLDVSIYSIAASSGQEQQQRFRSWLSNLLAEDRNEWVLFLRSGDRMYPNILSGLSLFRDKISLALAFYTDKMVLNADGGTSSLFLPDFDLDYFLAVPEHVGRGAFFRRELCMEIIKSRDISHQTVEMDFLLQLVNARLTSDIQHIALPLLHILPGEQDNRLLQEALLGEHLNIRGYSNASVERCNNDAFAIRYNAARIKKLTVIIVVEDEIDRIKRMLSTFVDSVTHIDYEIIFIDNASHESGVRAWLSSLSDINDDIFRVCFVDEKISAVSALNYGLSVARGDFTLYLSCGIYFNNNVWLDALMNHCGRPDIFACAPFLIDKLDALCSPGVIDGTLRRKYDQADAEHSAVEWIYPELIAPQEFLLLGTECIMIRTAACHQAGGLNEGFITFQEAVGDLLLRASGSEFVNLSVPLAQVRYDEILSDAELSHSDALFTAKWIERLVCDPVFNPNLSWDGERVVRENKPSLIAARLGLELNALFLSDPDDSAEAQRVKELTRLITQGGIYRTIQVSSRLTFTELYRMKPEYVVLSDVMAYKHSQLFKYKRSFPSTRFIVEVTKASFRINTPQPCCNEIIGDADILLVRNTAALKLFSYKNVLLQADKLSADWQCLVQAGHYDAENHDKPRVGIVLSDLLPEDWRHLDPLIKEMSEAVCWIIYGACPDAWKPYIHEYHRKVPQNRLPQLLRSLNLTFALAPLSDSLLNQAEGHRVIAQLGACGYPVLASDHDAYKGIMSIKRVKNKTSQWRFMINKMMSNPLSLRKLSENIYQEVNADWVYQQGERPAWLTRKDH